MFDIYLPTYNPNASHLRAAIESVLAQTNANWKLWIVDQVNEVDTQSIVAEYCRDERIFFHKNTDHPGIGANWNACLQYGDAPYVAYIFQDDLWQPEYVDTSLAIFNEHPDVGMISMEHNYLMEGDVPTQNVYSHLKQHIEENIAEGKHVGTDFLEWWMEQGLHPNVIGEPSFVVLRRETVDAVGAFSETMNQNLDSEYWARCLLQTNWHYQKGCYGDFRVHRAAASMQNFESGRGIFDRYRMLKKIAVLMPPKFQSRAKEILNDQLRIMVQKFIKRYDGKDVHIAPGMNLVTFGLKHPLLMIRSVINFMRKRK